MKTKDKKEEEYLVWNCKNDKYYFSGTWEECEKWIKENGSLNFHDYCII